MGVLESIVLGAAGYERFASVVAKRSLTTIASNAVWERIGDYEVYLLPVSKFMQSTVLLKSSGRDALVAEERMTESAHSCLRRYGVMSSSVLASTMRVGQRYILPLLFQAGNPLWSVKEERSYLDASWTLGVVHAAMPVDATSRGEYELSVGRRCRLDTRYDKEIVESLASLARQANRGQRVVFKKDAHPDNWIVAKNDVVPIDFEPKGSTHPANDMCKLLFQRAAWREQDVRDLVNDAVEAYAAGRSEAGNPLTTKERAGLPEAVLRSTPYRAVSYAASQKSGGRKELRTGFLRNAKVCLDIVGEQAFTAAANYLLCLSGD